MDEEELNAAAIAAALQELEMAELMASAGEADQEQPQQELCHEDGCSEQDGSASSAVEAAPAPVGDERPGTEVDALTCAICLCAPAPVDLALVKGCEHTYCVHCILQWASYKEHPQCPQCKTPINYLYVHRQLDGSVSDYAIEESIVLLKRATWHTAHMESTGGDAAGGSGSRRRGAYDEHYDYDDGDDDEELENYYYSSAAGRARIVLGNRRFGENGYVRGGRMLARPRPNAAAAGPSTAGKVAHCSGASAKPAERAPKARTPMGADGGEGSTAGRTGSTGSADSAPLAGSPPAATAAHAQLSPPFSAHSGGAAKSKKQGRRAMRTARREAADASEASAFLDRYLDEY